MSNEELFLRLLLIHGGDPEPDDPNPSEVYSEWWREVESTLSELGIEKEERRDYISWLKAKGLHNVKIIVRRT